MGDNSKIDWCDATINPLGWGCYGPNGTAEKPERCPWCYAYRMARRNLQDCPDCREFVPHYHEEEWTKIKHWKRPRRIFVQSMGDLWGPGTLPPIADEMTWYAASNPQHTFIALTKRPDNMKAWTRGLSYYANGDTSKLPTPGLPPNLWLGVSVTNQQDAGRRIPLLLETPAALRFVSIEPMLGPVDLRRWLDRDHACGCGGVCDPREPCPMRDHARLLDWVIVGAQTGPGAVPPKREWVQSLVEQCKAAGVPVFLKRNLARAWPGELVQEYPK